MSELVLDSPPRVRSPWPSRAAKIAPPLLLVVLAPFALRSVHLHDVVARMGSLPAWALLAAAAAALAQVAIMATRFWLVIRGHQRPRWSRVARALTFGQVVNLYVPGRPGDVVRGVVLAKDHATLTVADATGAMLADKALDVVTLAVLAVVFGRGLLVSALAGSGHAAIVLGIAAGAAAVACALLARFAPRAFAKVRAAFAATKGAAQSLLSPARLGACLAAGFAGWLAELSVIALVSAGLGIHLTFPEMAAALVVLNLGIAVPVSVANIGAYEAAMVVGLTPFGVSATDAIAVGMIHHAMQIAAVLLPALVFWAKDRVAATRR